MGWLQTKTPHQRPASGFGREGNSTAIGDTGWALDARYSVVDPTLLVYFRWGNRLGLDMPNLYPKWTRHTRAMLDRPAVKKVMAAEDISAWE